MGARCGLLHTVRYSPDATSLAHPKINQHTLDGGADACNAMESIMAVGVRHPQTCIQTLTIANANGNLTSIIIVALRNMICWQGCSSHTHTYIVHSDEGSNSPEPEPSLFEVFAPSVNESLTIYERPRGNDDVKIHWSRPNHRNRLQQSHRYICSYWRLFCVQSTTAHDATSNLWHHSIRYCRKCRPSVCWCW